MPNDEGLRRCSCGQYLIWHKDMRRLDWAESANLPYLTPIPEYRLQQCVSDTLGSRLELPARLAYWRSLNQRHRDAFYSLREQQKLAAKRHEFDWYLANPDRRTWWQKLMRYPAPVYLRSASQPLLMPHFEPTTVQTENMQQLSELIATDSEAFSDVMTLAELQRQLGRFDETLETLQQVPVDQQNEMFTLIRHLAEGKNRAPALLRGC